MLGDRAPASPPETARTECGAAPTVTSGRSAAHSCERLEPRQVGLDGRVAEAPLAGIGRTIEAAARVGGEQQHDPQPDVLGRLADRLGERVGPLVRRAVGLVVDVVELADRRVAGVAHLREAAAGDVVDRGRGRGGRAAAYIASRHVQKSSSGRRGANALHQPAQVALEACEWAFTKPGASAVLVRLDRRRPARARRRAGPRSAVAGIERDGQVAVHAGRVEHDVGHEREGHVVIPGRSRPVARAWSSASS